jgi:hypothetical protein
MQKEFIAKCAWKFANNFSVSVCKKKITGMRFQKEVNVE